MLKASFNTMLTALFSKGIVHNHFWQISSREIDMLYRILEELGIIVQIPRRPTFKLRHKLEVKAE